MGYEYGICRLSLKDYKKILTERNLIPSMLILRENIDEIFDKISISGVNNIEELYLKIETKKKALIYAEKLGISQQYMIVLRRAVSSFKKTLRKIFDYSYVDDELKQRLRSIGLKTSKELFDFFVAHSQEQVESVLNLDEKKLSYLRALMDISRLRYVTPLFSILMIESGYNSVEKISNAEHSTLHTALMETNKRLDLYRGKLGKNDTLFLIEDAVLFLSIDNG